MGRRFRSFHVPLDDPARRDNPRMSALCKNRRMELTWYGRTCIRLRGKDAVVVNDPYPSIVGPTGRGITGDVVTFSHPDDSPIGRKAGKISRDGGTVIPGSLESAFVLDGPGEWERHYTGLAGRAPAGVPRS